MSEQVDQFVARQLASGKYQSKEALVEEALRLLQKREEEAEQSETHRNGEQDAPPTQARKPIWEQFIEASLEIPDEELDRLPTDGATQHDHYIYGTPKRTV